MREITINKIHYYNIIFFLYTIFTSYFQPVLNFNDLYIAKFLTFDEFPYFLGYIFKLENKYIYLSYLYVVLNIIIFIALYYLFFIKKKIDLVTVNIKHLINSNFVLFFIILILSFLKVSNIYVNNNLHYNVFNIFFIHTAISLILSFSLINIYTKFYLSAALFVSVMYLVLIDIQIFVIYLLLVSLTYFSLISNVFVRKKFIIFIILGIIFLFALNFFKLYVKEYKGLMTNFDPAYAERCSFLTVDKINDCGKYTFNTELKFRNNIVPVPPSTYKIIYKLPDSHYEYQLYSMINRGMERLLKMTYLVSDMTTLNDKNSKFANEFLHGETYKLLITKFIPRILYKNKPEENLGQMYGKKFNYLPKIDITTSENLSSLVESYINFGFYGIAIFPISLIIFVFLIFKFLNILNSEFKLIGLTVFPLIFINSVESNTSGWVGGIITYLFLLVILNLITKFVNTKKLFHSN